MVSFRFKRYTLAALAMLFVLAVGLLLPPSQVAAGPGTPPPPVGPKTDLPKPSGAQNSANAQTGSQAGSDASLNGQKTERLKPTNRSTTPSAAVTAAWSVSLTSSTSTPSVNQGFTLTARANQDVGPTPYYIQIYLGSTRYASCGSGTICSVTLYSSAAGASYTFQARISAYDGSSAQAWSNTVTVRITTSWSVSLSSSSTSPTVGQSYTLTARANQDVGPTPYYIQIYLGSTRYASCGSGTTCSVTLSGSQAGASYTYQARISLYDGSNVQAWSNTLVVSIVLPSSGQLNVPFLTQVGSAGVSGSGSNNCGPASVAMSINFFNNAVTVANAAIAIRGYNNAYNGTTDFKSTSTTQYLSRYGLHPNSVSTFDDVRREIALGHPVIILVNNNTYRYNSPAPYANNNNGWFTTAHIIVVTGYNTSYVYVNDPLRYANQSTSVSNPANYPLPISTFKNAASTTPSSSSSSWYAISVSR